MGKERTSDAIKKKETRTSEFIHISEIIPGVLRDIQKRIKKSHKKASLGTEVEKEVS